MFSNDAEATAGTYFSDDATGASGAGLLEIKFRLSELLEMLQTLPLGKSVRFTA